MNMFIKSIAPVLSVILLLSGNATAADLKKGADLVKKRCAACHLPGVMGAPKIGAAADWDKRIKRGYQSLFDNAKNGLNGMPARGGVADLSDAELENAVHYLLAEVKLLDKALKTKSVAKDSKPEDKKASEVTQTKAVTAKQAQSKEGQAKVAKSLQFNRLMKSAGEWNPPPYEDGIHDPEGEGAYALQPPKELFDNLDKANSGNRVNWVKSLDEGKISPRYDKLDANKKPFVMDLNIVREVKGFMPDVVYPHKQHTEWLDCSNCHPAIFIPKKGANQISMASILMGEKCGVCHGKVAFPVSDCRKCHSKKKDKPVGIKLK